MLLGSFNPRAREGRDDYSGSCKSVGGMVSIHAPARGATAPNIHTRILSKVSIHAPARGATQPIDWTPLMGGVSIHAPARGATTAVARVLAAHPRFNPRAREGRDKA